MSVSDECKAGANEVIYFTEDCCVTIYRLGRSYNLKEQ